MRMYIIRPTEASKCIGNAQNPKILYQTQRMKPALLIIKCDSRLPDNADIAWATFPYRKEICHKKEGIWYGTYEKLKPPIKSSLGLYVALTQAHKNSESCCSVNLTTIWCGPLLQHSNGTFLKLSVEHRSTIAVATNLQRTFYDHGGCRRRQNHHQCW